MTDTTSPEPANDPNDPLARALHRASYWKQVAEKAEARVAELKAVSAVVPAADRAALRDRIADTVRAFPFDDFGMDDVSYALEAAPDSQEWVPKLADAVLSVLPAPADRAAVLEEAAAAVAADTGFHIRYGAAIDYATHYAALLRRLAAEAAAVSAVGVAADTGAEER